MIVALTNAANWLGYHGVGGIERFDPTKLLLLIHSIALIEILLDRSSPQRCDDKTTLQIITISLYRLVDFYFTDCKNSKDWLEAIFHSIGLSTPARSHKSSKLAEIASFDDLGK
jgi:hypothetical protein